MTVEEKKKKKKREKECSPEKVEKEEDDDDKGPELNVEVLPNPRDELSTISKKKNKGSANWTRKKEKKKGKSYDLVEETRCASSSGAATPTEKAISGGAWGGE